jgi:NMD protein affecting ribosome stability and mRNA decay
MKTHESPHATYRDRRISGRAQQTHIDDPYKGPRKLAEPSVCTACGAVYIAGHWRWSSRPANAHETLCQACQRIHDKYPAGVVIIKGGFVGKHRADIVQLIRNAEEHAKAEHPLNRIMSIEDKADGIVVNTTDIHLPCRIGHALRKAFHGVLETRYEPHTYAVHVSWHRDK